MTENTIVLKPHHCGISVPDLEASIQWYGQMLGFALEKRSTIEPIAAQVAILRHGDFRMELFEVENAQPLPDERRYPNRDLGTHGTKHIAFEVQNVETVVATLKQKGVDVAMDVFEIEGTRVAFIRDNAGILIELIELLK